MTICKRITLSAAAVALGATMAHAKDMADAAAGMQNLQAGADDYETGPAGDAGWRIACGVVSR
jgi:hypothetical protein